MGSARPTRVKSSFPKPSVVTDFRPCQSTPTKSPIQDTLPPTPSQARSDPSTPLSRLIPTPTSSGESDTWPVSSTEGVRFDTLTHPPNPPSTSPPRKSPFHPTEFF